MSFGRTTIGSTLIASGLRRCSSARTPATIIRVPPPAVSASLRSRHNTSMRLPIVSTLGLIRSNGSVSHAGNSTTESGGMNWQRSSYNCPASVPVGVATNSGWRSPSWASAATETARADSGTATSAAGLPKAWVSPVSSRSNRGSVASDMTVAQGTEPLNWRIAASGPSASSTSTASAAVTTATSSNSRSAFGSRDST